MDDRPMLVAEAAYKQGIELDYDQCEALAAKLGEAVYDADALTLALKNDTFAFAA